MTDTRGYEMALEEQKLRNESFRMELVQTQDELEAAENEIDELRTVLAGVLDALEDAINQACYTADLFGEEAGLDSMALSAYAHGLKELAKHGKVKIHHQVGRRVIASWIKQEGDK